MAVQAQDAVMHGNGTCMTKQKREKYWKPTAGIFSPLLVNLTQKNIPTDDFSKINIRLGCDSGWSFFLVNLKSVYEGGLDLREKNERQKGMVNC